KIVFAGTLEGRKGFVELINAVKSLRKERYNITLFLIGKHGRYSRRILRRQKLSTKNGWLKILGEVPRREIAKYYYSADICCFPSWFETVGIVCLEAMACGSIVIGSTNSGMAEIIRDGIDGFLVQPKNAFLLAAAIKKVINLSSEEKAKIRKEAKRRILENYDNSAIVPQLLHFYKTVIENLKLNT
ncbi:MAG: glycosyltransferase family 4 protein, partial [Candidatus Hodarchaeota archaeon]